MSKRLLILWLCGSLCIVFSGMFSPVMGTTVPEGNRSIAEKMFNVREYGARGDGANHATKAIQAAIESCARAGGGKVYFPAGKYLSGTIYLRSGVRLYLEKGAVLSGSVSLGDYPRTIPAVRSYTDNYTQRSLIYGEGLEDIGIEGEGTLDGHGGLLRGPPKWRPYLIRFVNCRRVSVSGIMLKDSAMWAQHYLACDDVQIRGITVRNRCNINNDGIDIDGSHRVEISDCDISAEDDAIVLKSTLDRQCQDVVITNCRLSSDNNALKLGTESTGGFARIRMNGCVIYNTRNAGVALETVDGGVLEDVEVWNLKMEKVAAPIFIRLGNRGRPYQAGIAKPGPGVLRQVRIRDVAATGANRIGCSITGLPGHPAEDIQLENIRIRFEGGAREMAAGYTVREVPAKYPEYSMFGMLPAYGFYCRHVSGLQLHNVEVDFSKNDGRPGLVCEDVSHLDLAAWKAEVSSPNHTGMRFRDVANAVVDGAPVVDAAVYAPASTAGTNQVRPVPKDSGKTRKLLGVIPGDAGTRLLGIFGLKKSGS